MKGINETIKPDIKSSIDNFDMRTVRDASYNADKLKPIELKPNPDGFYTSLEERIDRTPINKPEGVWEGDRGLSKYISLDSAIQEKLKAYGVDGIEYKNGEPDFSKVSVISCEIDNMTENRYVPGGNFKQFDEKIAQKFNELRMNGKDDWTPRDVANFIKENNLVRHERCDCKTMDLLDADIHKAYPHSGGCSECRHRDGTIKKGGGFDA